MAVSSYARPVGICGGGQRLDIILVLVGADHISPNSLRPDRDIERTDTPFRSAEPGSPETGTRCRKFRYELGFIGAGEGIRTLDPNLGKVSA